jgi:hypothetical protein
MSVDNCTGAIIAVEKPGPAPRISVWRQVPAFWEAQLVRLRNCIAFALVAAEGCKRSGNCTGAICRREGGR